MKLPQREGADVVSGGRILGSQALLRVGMTLGKTSPFSSLVFVIFKIAVVVLAASL